MDLKISFVFIPHTGILSLFKKILFILRQRGREREREGERKGGRETSMCGCLSRTPTGDLAPNPGMCPDWESNWQPFGLQAGYQSTEPHQPGQFSLLCALSIDCPVLNLKVFLYWIFYFHHSYSNMSRWHLELPHCSVLLKMKSRNKQFTTDCVHHSCFRA